MQATSSSYRDDLAMLRAGIRFAQKAGRPPTRLDFREPARSEWEATLGLELPSADVAARRFGGWTEYLTRMGYGTNQGGPEAIVAVEETAIAHCEDAYPELELVRSEQSAWDAFLGEKRVEIKGSALAARKDRPDQVYFSFKTHGRELSKTVDAVWFVGVGQDQDTGAYVPLVRLEFPKSALRMLDNKSTVMIYAHSIFGGGSSRYSPYVRWRNPDRKILSRYLPPRERS